MGTRLWRLGKANVVCPSPPYVVPIRLKSASFWSIGIIAPLQNAHPTGAKFPANILISPINGLDIFRGFLPFLESLRVYVPSTSNCAAQAYACPQSWLRCSYFTFTTTVVLA